MPRDARCCRSELGAEMASPERRAAWFAFSLCGVTALLAVYFYVSFARLDNPVTHAFPLTFDLSGYAQRYYQTAADFQLSWRLSAAALAVGSFCLAYPAIDARGVLDPVHRAFARARGAPRSSKMALLVAPLVLLEAGFVLYGSLIGLERADLSLWAGVDGNPVVRALVLGPLGPLGSPTMAGQDYYFLLLFGWVIAAAALAFGSLRRVAQLGALSIIPLPVMILLFDPIEFNTFFASVLETVGVPWLTNAVLLYLAMAVLAAATAYPFARRWLLRVYQGDGPR
jgi:hypothetical protein